jgi:hypothetical protein
MQNVITTKVQFIGGTTYIIIANKLKLLYRKICRLINATFRFGTFFLPV